MKIIIDADSTPFKEEIIKTAEKYGIKAVLVMSTEHFSEKNEGSYAEIILVDNRPQEADIKIMNLSVPGDIVITNDMPLAYMLQGKKAVAINSRGITVSGKDMGPGMEIHHEEKKMRRSGKKIHIKGPKKHTGEEVKKLIASVEKAITGL